MTRFAFATFLTIAIGSGMAAWAAGCSDAEVSTASSPDASSIRRDAAPVDPSEAGLPLDGGIAEGANCEKYCALVMANCSGDNAQYASLDECTSFCGHLPLGEAVRDDAKDSANVACRQYWAGTPAKTSPDAYCLAAGPFGGNTCGDRCTAFCDVLLSACSSDGGAPTYASRDECRTNCKYFAYRDAGDDGGGETPSGPAEGDSFNCRLYWLREAASDATHCAALAPNSDTCKD